MPKRYNNNFKSMIVNLICNEKHSTITTAKQFQVPLKTVEKWITAYNKDKHIFDANYKSQAQIIKELEHKLSLSDRNNEILKKTINDGNLYLISFIDMFSKKVVSWDLYCSQTTGEILNTLKKGIMLRKPKNGLIIHSDKGSQFRSAIYRIFLSSHNIIQSFTSLNHSCDENASQESFHASHKKEKLYQIKLYNYQDAYNAIYEYIEGFYNPVRTHSSIGYNSPNDFEKKHKKQ